MTEAEAAEHKRAVREYPDNFDAVMNKVGAAQGDSTKDRHRGNPENGVVDGERGGVLHGDS